MPIDEPRIGRTTHGEEEDNQARVREAKEDTTVRSGSGAAEAGSGAGHGAEAQRPGRGRLGPGRVGATTELSGADRHDGGAGLLDLPQGTHARIDAVLGFIARDQPQGWPVSFPEDRAGPICPDRKPVTASRAQPTPRGHPFGGRVALVVWCQARCERAVGDRGRTGASPCFRSGWWMRDRWLPVGLPDRRRGVRARAVGSWPPQALFRAVAGVSSPWSRQGAGAGPGGLDRGRVGSRAERGCVLGWWAPN